MICYLFFFSLLSNIIIITYELLNLNCNMSIKSLELIRKNGLKGLIVNNHEDKGIRIGCQAPFKMLTLSTYAGLVVKNVREEKLISCDITNPFSLNIPVDSDQIFKDNPLFFFINVKIVESSTLKITGQVIYQVRAKVKKY